MFYLKLTSTHRQWSPSYYTLTAKTQDEAITLLRTVFRPFHTSDIKAEIVVQLYMTGAAMGEETLLREMQCKIDKPLVWFPSQHGEKSYRHPQDLTVFKSASEIPEQMLEELELHTTFVPYNFPNGSHYFREKLNSGTFNLPSFGPVTVDNSYIAHGWIKYSIPSDEYHGPGTDFGAYYCTRDKEIAAFKAVRDRRAKLKKENTNAQS